MGVVFRALLGWSVGLVLAVAPMSAAARLDDTERAFGQVHRACLKAASFARLPVGWRQQSGGCASTFSHGSLSVWTQATSWRYISDPHGPLRQMRSDRVLIEVILSRPAGFRKSARFAPLTRPLNLARPDQVATEEGAPTIAQYRFFRRVTCQYALDLRVDFGTLHPTPGMLGSAQRALNGLTLHRWISHC